MFFTAVYLKCPPKVLVCLAIIPVGGGGVPKKFQPYIWGLLTIGLLSIWGWVHLPEGSRTSWQSYQYKQELPAIEQNTQDDIPNAADLYHTVLAEHGESIFAFPAGSEDDHQTYFTAWNPRAYPKVDPWLSTYTEAMNTFIDATRIEFCRFKAPSNIKTMNMQMKRINQLKGWSRLLIRTSNRDLYLNCDDDALEKLLAVTALAQHLYQQQTLFDQSAAIHIELIAARALQRYIVDHCQSSKHLEQIEQTFLQMDPGWTSNWPGILQREKLLTKNIAALMYEENQKGRIRISHNAMMALQEGLGYRPRRLFWNQEKMNRISVVGLWLMLPSSPEKLSRLIDERFDHFSQLVQAGEQLPRYHLKYIWALGLNVSSIIDWLATEQIRYYSALDGHFQQHRALINQIQIFCALKRYAQQHGRWPQQLDQLSLDSHILTDPLYGKPVIYKLTDDGFRLYSPGPNGIDDGGIYIPKGPQDDILIWPKAQSKENTVHI